MKDPLVAIIKGINIQDSLILLGAVFWDYAERYPFFSPYLLQIIWKNRIMLFIDNTHILGLTMPTFIKIDVFFDLIEFSFCPRNVIQ